MTNKIVEALEWSIQDKHTPGSVAEYMRRAVEIVKRVDAMVRTSVDQVCWRDCYVELSRLLGLEFVPQLIWDKQCFLANCEVYINSLMSGDYKPIFVVPSDLVVKARALLLEWRYKSQHLDGEVVEEWLKASKPQSTRECIEFYDQMELDLMGQRCFGLQGQTTPGWYFWDETWTTAHGPYASEMLAVGAVEEYARGL